MGEIIPVSFGQCGTRVGYKFMEAICDEHGIMENGFYCGESEMQLEKIHVYFTEAVGGRYVPRSVLVDLEPCVLESVRCSPFGELFKPDNFIFGQTGAGNNWAKGYHTEGKSNIAAAMEAIRREAEACSNMQGFHIFHSVGGGCGSGMGSLAIDEIRLDFPKRLIFTTSLFPSEEASETVVEPYNSILTIPTLLKSSQFTFIADNDSLRKVCEETLKLNTPQYSDMNHLIAMAMASTSCCTRFPSQLTCDYAQLIDTAVPKANPRLHFVIPGFVPLSSRGVQPYRTLDTLDLLQQMFANNVMMAKCDPTQGRYIKIATVFRGNFPMSKAENAFCILRNRIKPKNVNEIEVCGVCNIAPRGMKVAAVVLSNTTTLATTFNRLRSSFATMLKRKVYLHWYVGEGMQEQDFADAEIIVAGLVDEYRAMEKNLTLEAEKVKECTSSRFGFSDYHEIDK